MKAYRPRSTFDPSAGPFYVPEPKEGDTRPRNAFGFLIGFGKAYSAYYAKRAADAAALASHPNAAQAEARILADLGIGGGQ